MRAPIWLAGVLATLILLVITRSMPLPSERVRAEPPILNLPEFVPVMRPYAGSGYEAWQMSSLKRFGMSYVQGLADFYWGNLERGDDVWKWDATDQAMNRLAARGFKIVPGIICPKSPGLPWDETILRSDPRYVAEYGEFAYEITKRYHNHRAWSGIVAVWGGSSDVWDRSVPLTDPEVVVPLINAAYDGIKRADPNTIVSGFNFATTASSKSDWELFHRRAFALSPRFDWYGVQSHGVFTTALAESGGYGGVQGLAIVRRYLDSHGYSGKPLWLNEGGFNYGEDLGGVTEQVQAEQAVETFVVARSMKVNLKGWVYFEYFTREHVGEDFGIMTTLEETDPPRPRQAWLALQKLFKTVRLFDYRFDVRESGRVNQATPAHVYRFIHKDVASRRLWVVFSPRVGKTPIVNQTVTINIAPATRAAKLNMLGGGTTTLQADASGDVAVQSTSAPTYLKVDGSM